MHHSTPLSPPHRVVLEQAAVGAPGVRLFGYNRNFAASCAIAPHTHGHLFELVYVVSGELCFEADGRRDVLHGGDMYLTQPGQRHSTGASPTGVCEFYWLHLDAHCATCLGLNTSTARALLAALRGVRGCALHGKTRWDKVLGGLLRALTQERAAESPDASNAPDLPNASNRPNELNLQNTPEVLSASSTPSAPSVADALALQTACVLLPVLHDAVHRGTAAGQYTQDIDDAVRFVREHVCDTLPLTEIACAAHLSVARLKTKFMQQVGVPPRAFVNLTKIDAAKQMLLTGQNVTDTAFALSFSSSGYFSTQFKKFTGQSPSQFAQAAAGAGGTRKEQAV